MAESVREPPGSSNPVSQRIRVNRNPWCRNPGVKPRSATRGSVRWQPQPSGTYMLPGMLGCVSVGMNPGYKVRLLNHGWRYRRCSVRTCGQYVVATQSINRCVAVITVGTGMREKAGGGSSGRAVNQS